MEIILAILCGWALILCNDKIDALCDAGIENVDSNKRAQIYFELQNIWHADAIGIPL